MSLKKIFNYLNRRSTRLLPKNKTFTKVILVLLIGFLITFPIKKIFAEIDPDIQVDQERTGEASTNNGGSSNQNNKIKEELVGKQRALQDHNINSETWTKSNLITNALLGVNVLAGEKTESMLADTSSWTPDGLIGLTNQVIASLYKPPVSGTQYIANSINNILGKPTYAASTKGAFNRLTGLLPVWKVCRNAVYVLFSIVFVIMGLLIMLRIKISPQATITIQNSIPKIIITLILVTFSYAIIGLIIDLTYLAQALFLSLLLNSGSRLITGIPSISTLIRGSFDTFSDLSFSAMYTNDLSAVNASLAVLGTTVGAIIGGISGGLAGAAVGTAAGAAIGLLILLIFAFIQIIKFFFGCVKAYITLLIKIVSAPLEIALGAFPNSKTGFGSWFIQTLAYASVFPISLVFLVFLNIICNAVSFSDMWIPGVLESSIVSPYIGSIIGLAGLIILAKLPDLIPEAIFQIKPSPFGKALAEGAKAYPGHRIVGAATGIAKSGLSFYAGQEISRFLPHTGLGRFISKKQSERAAKVRDYETEQRDKAMQEARSTRAYKNRTTSHKSASKIPTEQYEADNPYHGNT